MESTSDQPAIDPASRRTASNLIDAGQYERLADVLHRAQVACAQTGQESLARALAVAGQICLACKECQTEVHRHQQAHHEAVAREQELRKQLQDLLDAIHGDEEDAATDVPEEHTPSTLQPQPKLTEEESPQPEERFGLLQRIQNLLGWHADQPADVAPSAEAPEQTMPPPIEEAPPAVPSVEEPEAPAEPSAEEVDGVTEADAEESVPPEPAPVEQAEEAPEMPDQEPQEPAVPPVEEIDAPATSGPEFAEEAAAPARVSQEESQSDVPSLMVYCLGAFRVYQDDQPVADWPSGKGKSIFKYLVTHRERPAPKEVLMELFWPDSEPDSARNNLNVAIYGLRQALRKVRPEFHHVLFEEDCYLLNPELQIWVDVEEFEERINVARKLQQRGDVDEAIRNYATAEALYRGEFLAEDRYEEWLIPYRRGLQGDYLELLEHLSRYYLDREDYAACVSMCEKMLAVEPCREDAHRRLMRSYCRQGQRYLALRQYHLCKEALEEELDVEPSRRTVKLHEQIRRRESV